MTWFRDMLIRIKILDRIMMEIPASNLNMCSQLKSSRESIYIENYYAIKECRIP